MIPCFCTPCFYGVILATESFVSNNPLAGKFDGLVVFDELDKSTSHILLNQVSEYFLKTQKGRIRSRLIIPEPFFVHSDLTTMVQVADLIAYLLSWGVRLKGMTASRRAEFDIFSQKIMQLRFTQRTPGGHTNYGFKAINNLRSATENKKAMPFPAKPLDVR